MAYVTGTDIGNSLTRIAWSSKLHRETQDRLFFQQQGLRSSDMGNEDAFRRGGRTPIITQEALNNKRAQQVRVGLHMQLTRNRSIDRFDASDVPAINQYTYSTGNMIDQEETMSLNSFTAWVEQMKHATSFDVPEIQDLRTEFKMTVKAADNLSDWMAAEMEESTLDAIYHRYSAHVVAGISSVSAADIPTANQFFGGNKADNASLGSTDRLTAAELRRMYTWAEVNNINPMRHAGKNCFVLLCHTYNYADLWNDEEYRSGQRDGNVRGNGNPQFDMSDGEFQGVYVYQYNRIRSPVTGGNKANVRRCILMGADAIAEGVTSRPRLVRRKEDRYEDIFGLAIKAINGCARADWIPNSGTTFNQSLAIWSLYTNSAV